MGTMHKKETQLCWWFLQNFTGKLC